MDTAIDRSIFPAGVHWCDTTRSDLQGGVHLVREHPTEAIRHNAVHPTAHQRGPRRSTALRARGSWAYHPSLSGSLRGRWIPRNSIMDADPTVPQCGTERLSELSNEATSRRRPYA